MSRRAQRLLLAALLLAPGLASAACVGLMGVTATTVNFLTYDPLSGQPADGVGSVTVACVGLGLLPNLSVKMSAGTSGVFSARQMALGAARLRYNLYTDSNRSSIWGDGSPGTSVVAHQAILSLGAHLFTVYGRIPIGQDRPAGTYLDSITVTVEF